MIGIGIGVQFSKGSIIDPPSGLTLTLISGGVQIDFTSDDANQTEVWGRSDSGVSALITTVAAGTHTYNDTVVPVDLRYYKVRALRGSLYSAFSAEVGIAMLGAELMPAVSVWAAVGLAWWSAVEAGMSGDGVNLIYASDHDYQTVTKYAFWATAKTYRVNTTAVRTSGGIIIYGGADYTGCPTITASGSKSSVFKPDAVNINFMAFTRFVGSVSAISIKEILFP
jgi:hypothetical protein